MGMLKQQFIAYGHAIKKACKFKAQAIATPNTFP